jgi:hypothetical protein
LTKVTVSILFESLIFICTFADSLKIGDYVILKDTAAGFYLSAEGILIADIYGLEDISSLHDALFCVHLQRQYSASRELNTFLEAYGMDTKNITDESELKYLQALEVWFLSS